MEWQKDMFRHSKIDPVSSYWHVIALIDGHDSLFYDWGFIFVFIVFLLVCLFVYVRLFVCLRACLHYIYCFFFVCLLFACLFIRLFIIQKWPGFPLCRMHPASPLILLVEFAPLVAIINSVSSSWQPCFAHGWEQYTKNFNDISITFWE